MEENPGFFSSYAIIPESRTAAGTNRGGEEIRLARNRRTRANRSNEPKRDIGNVFAPRVRMRPRALVEDPHSHFRNVTCQVCVVLKSTIKILSCDMRLSLIEKNDFISRCSRQRERDRAIENRIFFESRFCVTAKEFQIWNSYSLTHHLSLYFVM